MNATEYVMNKEVAVLTQRLLKVRTSISITNYSTVYNILYSSRRQVGQASALVVSGERGPLQTQATVSISLISLSLPIF